MSLSSRLILGAALSVAATQPARAGTPIRPAGRAQLANTALAGTPDDDGSSPGCAATLTSLGHNVIGIDAGRTVAAASGTPFDPLPILALNSLLGSQAAAAALEDRAAALLRICRCADLCAGRTLGRVGVALHPVGNDGHSRRPAQSLRAFPALHGGRRWTLVLPFHPPRARASGSGCSDTGAGTCSADRNRVVAHTLPYAATGSAAD